MGSINNMTRKLYPSSNISRDAKFDHCWCHVGNDLTEMKMLKAIVIILLFIYYQCRNNTKVTNKMFHFIFLRKSRKMIYIYSDSSSKTHKSHYIWFISFYMIKTIKSNFWSSSGMAAKYTWSCESNTSRLQRMSSSHRSHLEFMFKVYDKKYNHALYLSAFKYKRIFLSV